MNLLPVGNKLLIQQFEAPAHSPGGITLPDQAKEAPKRGKVLEIGSEVDPKKYDFVIGDEVVFTSYAGVKVEFAGINYLILEDEEVIAKVVI